MKKRYTCMVCGQFYFGTDGCCDESDYIEQN